MSWFLFSFNIRPLNSPAGNITKDSQSVNPFLYMSPFEKELTLTRSLKLIHFDQTFFLVFWKPRFYFKNQLDSFFWTKCTQSKSLRHLCVCEKTATTQKDVDWTRFASLIILFPCLGQNVFYGNDCFASIKDNYDDGCFS